MANILLIEDEANLRESLADILNDKGYVITQVEDGLKGIQALGNNTFDVIITDLRTPTIDSISLLDQLGQRSKGAEIIVITGHLSRLTLNKSEHINVYAYLEKPFSAEYLISLIEGILKKKGEVYGKNIGN